MSLPRMAQPAVHVAAGCQQCQDTRFPNPSQEAIDSGLEGDIQKLYRAMSKHRSYGLAPGTSEPHCRVAKRMRLLFFPLRCPSIDRAPILVERYHTQTKKKKNTANSLRFELDYVVPRARAALAVD